MITARETPVPTPTGWKLLLRLLALPLAFSGLLLGAWFTGGPEAWGRVASSQLAMALGLPLSTTWAALNLLKRGSDRSLVLPTPLMMWLVLVSQRAEAAPWQVIVIAHAAWLVMLAGCWRRKRVVAQGAAICCGMAATWLQLSGVIQHG